MNQGEIIIAGKAHPVRFNMGAIERVFTALDIADFSQLADTVNSQIMGKTLANMTVIAYEGIRAGYRNLAHPCPFKDAEDLAEEVNSFKEIAAVMPIFNAAIADFFATDEDTGELTGAGEGSPSVSVN